MRSSDRRREAWARQQAVDDEQASRKKQSFRRVRLLNEELDKLVADATTRSASVANKASFLAVSTGVLVAATTGQLWMRATIVGICALALASAGLLSAAMALRPGKRSGLDAQRLVDRYLDSTRMADSIERDLVVSKADSISALEPNLRNRAGWVTAGFFSLAASTILLTIVYAIEVSGD